MSHNRLLESLLKVVNGGRGFVLKLETKLSKMNLFENSSVGGMRLVEPAFLGGLSRN